MSDAGHTPVACVRVWEEKGLSCVSVVWIALCFFPILGTCSASDYDTALLCCLQGLARATWHTFWPTHMGSECWHWSPTPSWQKQQQHLQYHLQGMWHLVAATATPVLVLHPHCRDAHQRLLSIRQAAVAAAAAVWLEVGPCSCSAEGAQLALEQWSAWQCTCRWVWRAALGCCFSY
jgi:hypothetical protein